VLPLEPDEPVLPELCDPAEPVPEPDAPAVVPVEPEVVEPELGVRVVDEPVVPVPELPEPEVPEPLVPLLMLEESELWPGLVELPAVAPLDCEPVPLVLDPLEPTPELARPDRFVLVVELLLPKPELLERSDEPLTELPAVPDD
jgi:hypothetical protein